MKPSVSVKQQILDCSIQLFARKGFNATSIREIAEEAGTVIPNIYYYFGNKDALYNNILETTNDEFSKNIQLASAKKASLRDQLISMMKAKYSFIEEHPDRMRIIFREWFALEKQAEPASENDTSVLKALATMAYMVRERTNIGELRKVNPEHAAWLLVGTFNAFDIGFISFGLTPSDEEIEAVVDIALKGLSGKQSI